MQLSWSHSAEISAALLKAHPEADRLSLTHEQILSLILALPEFAGERVPPKPEYLDHIKWTWMRLAEGAGDDREKRSA